MGHRQLDFPCQLVEMPQQQWCCLAVLVVLFLPCSLSTSPRGTCLAWPTPACPAPTSTTTAPTVVWLCHNLATPQVKHAAATAIMTFRTCTVLLHCTDRQAAARLQAGGCGSASQLVATRCKTAHVSSPDSCSSNGHKLTALLLALSPVVTCFCSQTSRPLTCCSRRMVQATRW